MVSNIFYFHPYLGKIPILTCIFFKWVVQPPTSKTPSQKVFGCLGIVRESSRVTRMMGWRKGSFLYDGSLNRKGWSQTPTSCFLSRLRSQVGKISPTWRIIPVSKWLVTPICKPWNGHLEGVPQPYLGDLLTTVINHLPTGMILQVVFPNPPVIPCEDV